jgi:hypothetical protein
MKNTELFATQVKPHLEDMWDEYEDRWWPQPVAAEKRAVPASL